MSDKSKIEWTDATWNPVTGCTKVSQGCKHCYAERDWKRLRANARSVYYGRDFTNVQCHPERLDQPLRWRKPRRIFVNSMSDLFHEDVPWEFVDKVIAVMALAPQHVFQVLTKRPKWMRAYFATYATRHRWALCAAEFSGRMDILTRCDTEICNRKDFPPNNVWLGVSVEDQATADERIPYLLDTPAAVRWISAEPLLGPIDLRPFHPFCRPPMPPEVQEFGRRMFPNGLPENSLNAELDAVKIRWVVAGGESGPHARPSHPHWFESMRDQCAAAGVPFHFKQWGEWLPWLQFNEAGIDDDPEQSRYQALVWNVQTRAWESINGAWWDGDQWVIADDGDHPAQAMGRVGKKRAGRLLDGHEHNELPAPGGVRG